jgi:purine-binding chemotaxis protein CheW
LPPLSGHGRAALRWPAASTRRINPTRPPAAPTGAAQRGTTMGMMMETTRFAEEATVRTQEYLTFRLGAEEYGIDILKVQEIRGYDTVTRIANAPDFIKGVINLRGVIVPIVDLRLKFRLGEAKYDSFTVVIILNVANRVVGAVVDSVSDVLELNAEQVRPAPEFNSMLDASYIMGIGSVSSGADENQDRMLILVDIEKLMSAADMALVDAAVA